MLTIIFISVIGVILVGFLVWVLAFGGVKRRGQSAETEVNAQRMNEKPKRSA